MPRPSREDRAARRSMPASWASASGMRGSECAVPAAPPATCPAGARLLPKLFIIGSLKTGSTSLWSALVDNSQGRLAHGELTPKGDVSRKEKDFFGDPSQWRQGRRWYERIWPACPAAAAPPVVGIDATPAYHVWADAPKNMASFYAGRGPSFALDSLRLVWMLRDPVAKFWSYFWELKAYGGEWDSVDFQAWSEPKLARTRECLRLDPASPLWPPSMPPPYTSCAPHLDHGLYHPQLLRWLEYFRPQQFLMVSFAGYVAQPAAVVRDVLRHGGLPAEVAAGAGQVWNAESPSSSLSQLSPYSRSVPTPFLSLAVASAQQRSPNPSLAPAAHDCSRRVQAPELEGGEARLHASRHVGGAAPAVRSVRREAVRRGRRNGLENAAGEVLAPILFRDHPANVRGRRAGTFWLGRYSLLREKEIAISPCTERGTRFLDGAEWRNATSGHGGGGGKRSGRGAARGAGRGRGRGPGWSWGRGGARGGPGGGRARAWRAQSTGSQS